MHLDLQLVRESCTAPRRCQRLQPPTAMQTLPLQEPGSPARGHRRLQKADLARPQQLREPDTSARGHPRLQPAEDPQTRLVQLHARGHRRLLPTTAPRTQWVLRPNWVNCQRASEAVASRLETVDVTGCWRLRLPAKGELGRFLARVVHVASSTMVNDDWHRFLGRDDEPHDGVRTCQSQMVLCLSLCVVPSSKHVWCCQVLVCRKSGSTPFSVSWGVTA